MSFFFFFFFLRELHECSWISFFLHYALLCDLRLLLLAWPKSNQKARATLMTYSERYLAVRVASRSRCSLVQRSGRSARVFRLTVNAYARPRILRLRWVSVYSYLLFISVLNG